MIYRFSEKLAKTFVLQSMPCLYGCMKLKYQGHRHPLKIFKLKRTEASKLYKYFSISIPHQWLPLWNLLCAKISCVFLLSHAHWRNSNMDKYINTVYRSISYTILRITISFRFLKINIESNWEGFCVYSLRIVYQQEDNH